MEVENNEVILREVCFSRLASAFHMEGMAARKEVLLWISDTSGQWVGFQEYFEIKNWTTRVNSEFLSVNKVNSNISGSGSELYILLVSNHCSGSSLGRGGTSAVSFAALLPRDPFLRSASQGA